MNYVINTQAVKCTSGNYDIGLGTLKFKTE